MLTVYARKEPTTDAQQLKFLFADDRELAKLRDVVIYKDRECTRRYATFRWDSNKPDKRNKYITLNCYQWRLEWV